MEIVVREVPIQKKIFVPQLKFDRSDKTHNNKNVLRLNSQISHYFIFYVCQANLIWFNNNIKMAIRNIYDEAMRANVWIFISVFFLLLFCQEQCKRRSIFVDGSDAPSHKIICDRSQFNSMPSYKIEFSTIKEKQSDSHGSHIHSGTHRVAHCFIIISILIIIMYIMNLHFCYYLPMEQCLSCRFGLILIIIVTIICQIFDLQPTGF